MRKIFLPTLKNIRIQNYSLYPRGMDYNYDFVKGVNLIVGGNGMGKTTFVNIIKYAVIGNYKKQFSYARTYRERRIEKRFLYPSSYFSSRMDREYKQSEAASVTLAFDINKTSFLVERCLESVSLKSLYIDGEQIIGDITSQEKYESYDSDDKVKYLFFKYETAIAEASNLAFDDLIFFVNQILFFGEDHKTILWANDADFVDAQEELFNKYLNDPDLDQKRQEAQRLAKYYDSRSRHKSEDIRAIRKMLDRVLQSNEGNNHSSDEIFVIKDAIEKIDSNIERNQEKMVALEKDSSIKQNQLNMLSQILQTLEKDLNIADDKLTKNIWQKLHPQYETFIKNVHLNKVCPICNKPSDLLFQKVLSSPQNCFSCGQHIEVIADEGLEEEFKSLTQDYNSTLTKIQNIQQDLNINDSELSKLDATFSKFKQEKRLAQNKLRQLEFKDTKEERPQLQDFYDEIEKLEKGKNDFQSMSMDEKKKADQISQVIEEQIIRNVTKFSTLFGSFAEMFLGVPCSLTYDDLEGRGKRFYPVINRIPRKTEEELSESQRFFVDHSFRMSILSFFYTKPTYYIVETPDSSLDISYEENAANVFLNFLQQPNSLILTANLNNSLFINHLVDNKLNIPVSLIGLVDIAKQSVIQNTSAALLEIYNNLKAKISL